MKKKNTLWIVLAVLIVLAIIIWAVLGRTGKTEDADNAPAENTIQESSSPAESEQSDEAAGETEPSADENSEEAESADGSVMLENEGELEIIIPEGMGSDGF